MIATRSGILAGTPVAEVGNVPADYGLDSGSGVDDWNIPCGHIGDSQDSITSLSGIEVISGWKCDAGELTVRFNGGSPLSLVYGSERKDVLDAKACDQAEVGFVSIMNWGELGDGPHTAVVCDDDVQYRPEAPSMS